MAGWTCVYDMGYDGARGRLNRCGDVWSIERGGVGVGACLPGRCLSEAWWRAGLGWIGEDTRLPMDAQWGAMAEVVGKVRIRED